MKGKKVFWYFLKASIFLNWQLTPCILNKIQWNIYLIYCWWQVISSGYMSYHVILKCWPGQSWLRIWCRHDGFSFSYLRHQEDNIEKKMQLQSLQWVSKLDSDNVPKMTADTFLSFRNKQNYKIPCSEAVQTERLLWHTVICNYLIFLQCRFLKTQYLESVFYIVSIQTYFFFLHLWRV